MFDHSLFWFMLGGFIGFTLGFIFMAAFAINRTNKDAATIHKLMKEIADAKGK